jgi:acetate kinase
MRLLGERFPDIPLIAAFETGFHETIPEANRLYAVPWEWAERFGVRRWGFHGASHRYIAERMSELLGRSDARVISCHLGGSSSLCAIHAGRSVATSMGMSPQSGLPQNNRAGDFDPFALRVVMRATGKSLDEVLEDLAERSGLLGLSGASGDVRDLEAISRKGHERVWRALQVYIASVRHYLGAYFLELGGADAVVFTGGIGENSPFIRERVCRNLDWFGIGIDEDRNAKAKGETVITSKESWVTVWTIPTNEELIVARQVKECLNAAESGGA